MVLGTAARRRGLRRTASSTRAGSARRAHGDRHRTGAACAPPRPSAQLRVPCRRRRGPSQRARTGGAGARPRPVGCGRRLVRGGPQARPLPAQPVSPRGLPARRIAGCASPSRASRWWTPPTPSRSSKPHWHLVSTSTRRWCAPTCCGDRTPPATATTRATRRTGRRSSETPLCEDVAWSYEDPFPETLPIKGYLSFDAARAEVTAELPGV